MSYKAPYSRMRSRRVLVLRLGSGGWELVRNPCGAFASVRKRPPCIRKRPRPKIVAKRRIVVTFGLAFGLRVSKVSAVTGIGGVVVAKRQSNYRHFWTRVWSSRLKSVNSHRDRGDHGRERQNYRHFWTCVWFSRLKSVNSHRDRGGHGRERQNCRHFWTCVWFSRFKSVNGHRDLGGVVVAKCRIVVTFGRGRETQKRGERRGEERGEGKKREERREKSIEKREERGEKREERRDERRERREERRERESREERGERKREERGEE